MKIDYDSKITQSNSERLKDLEQYAEWVAMFQPELSFDEFKATSEMTVLADKERLINEPWNYHNLINRMKKRTNKTNSCWIWTGTKNRRGYGQINFYGRMHPAHRLSWMIANRQLIASRDYVCHRCDNPSCVNPDHLFVGSQLNNVADCVAKDRQARGERNRHAKLTDNEVRMIRIHSKCGIPNGFLSTQYKIDRSQICRIVNGQSWKHIK